MKQFNKSITSKLNGFGSDDKKFYLESSCGHYISDITIPTLFISSLDDPVCIKEQIPFDDIKENKNCFLMVTQSGGHIDYFTREYRPNRWVFKPTLEFL